MVDDGLREIGRILGVGEEDLRCLGCRGVARRLVDLVVASLIALLSFLLGFFAGRVGCPVSEVVSSTTSSFVSTSTSVLSTTTTTGAGYPYAAAALPVVLSGSERGRWSRVAVLLASALVFLLAFKAAPVFGQSVRYGVFSKHTMDSDIYLMGGSS